MLFDKFACWKASRARAALLTTLSLLSAGQVMSQTGSPLMELEVGSVMERGLPIAWHEREVVLLRTDGSIKQFEPREIRRQEILREVFRPMTAMQLRGKLQQEFGRNYAVEGSGDFMIVAPLATISLWREQFSQVQRAFEHFFRTRGYPLKPLDFPLVGIVFPNQAEFTRYSIQMGLNLPAGVVGYYSPITNRLYAYEMAGHPEAEREGLATIRHEAAHQLAFNRGLHQRLSIPPLWMMEGLASIFESEALMNPRSTLQPADLINRSRWQRWQELSQNLGSTARKFEQMIVDDRYFQRSAEDAYTLAWAVTLYLAERDTRSYIAFVQHYSRLEPGEVVEEGKRVGEFREYFKGDSLMLIKATANYLSNL
jgi:hypothetical protein